MIKVIEKIKSFWEWRMNFIKMHPFYSAWAAFVKGFMAQFITKVIKTGFGVFADFIT